MKISLKTVFIAMTLIAVAINCSVPFIRIIKKEAELQSRLEASPTWKNRI